MLHLMGVKCCSGSNDALQDGARLQRAPSGPKDETQRLIKLFQNIHHSKINKSV